MIKPATKYIAVIEDDPEDSEFFCSALTGRFSNVELLTFPGASEFYDYIQSDNREPDIIVTDLRMPWISGFQLIEKIKGDPQTCHIPVMILSTSSNREDIERAQSLGVIEYFVKPYTFREYDAIATRILKNSIEALN